MERADIFAGDASKGAAQEAYRPIRDFVKAQRVLLGNNTSCIIQTDPKLLLFTLAKYKFAGKMLEGKEVLEIGCMDGGGTLLLSSFSSELTSLDFYKPHIDDCNELKESGHIPNTEFIWQDFLEEDPRLIDRFEGAVSFDVLEHLSPNTTDLFFQITQKYLKEKGISIG